MQKFGGSGRLLKRTSNLVFRLGAQWDNMAATIIIELSEDNKLLCVHAVATAVDAHTDSGGLQLL